MGVALRHEGDLGSAPRRLLFSEGLLESEAPTAPADTNPLFDFTLDTNEVAAYSANWDAVFFAGGPTMGHQLRRYDLSTGKWSVVLKEVVEVGQTVLGLALDVPSARIYLLHAAQGLQGDSTLVRVDLRSQAVDVLATFTYTGDANLVALQTTESGALVLTRSDASGFDVWRLAGEEQAEVTAHSRVDGFELLDLPLVLGETLHAAVRPADGEDTILDIALDALQDDLGVNEL